MAYFDTKEGSLEEAIKAAVKNEKINEATLKVSAFTGKMPKIAGVTIKKTGSNRMGGDDIVMSGPEDKLIAYAKKHLGGEGKTLGDIEKSISETNKNDKSDDGEGLDAVQPKAVKKKFADRKDKDIDNDGDTDDSDKYLHKKRKAISKAVKNEEDELDEDKVSFGGALPKKPEGYMVTGGEGDNNQKIIGLVKTQKQAEKIRDDYNKKNNPKKPSHRARVYASRSAANDLKVGDDISWSRYSRKENYKKLKEAFEYGTPEATENSLNMTPGQSTDDWNKQVGVMQERQSSMRETLAKMWGVDEGHNPFKKEEEKNPKKEGKTMTGKPMTKVAVNSEKDT